MVIAKCSKCGREYELQEGESPADFQCECGGDLRLYNANKADVKDILKTNQKYLLPGISVVVVFIIIMGIGIFSISSTPAEKNIQIKITCSEGNFPNVNRPPDISGGWSGTIVYGSKDDYVQGTGDQTIDITGNPSKVSARISKTGHYYNSDHNNSKHTKSIPLKVELIVDGKVVDSETTDSTDYGSVSVQYSS